MPSQLQLLGLGRIGLPLAVTLSESGYRVRGVDPDPARLAALSDPAHPVHRAEPGLAERLRALLERGHLTVHPTPGGSPVHLLAVPTPLSAGRTADLSYLHGALESLRPHLRPGDLLLLESTCPPGTAEAVARDLALPGLRVATATERGLPGRMLAELLEVPRVVGGVDPESTEAAAAFYRSWARGPVHPTSARVAEVTKLVENAYRDVNLAFANQVDQLCRAHQVPTEQVIGLANHHPRVSVLTPGPGVGGHCIPVDPWFLLEGLPEGEGRLLRAARQVDAERRAWLVEEVVRLAGGQGRVACLGLTYKAEAEDLRGSAALQITERLMEALPGRVRACDPWAVGRVPFAESDPEAVIRSAGLVVGLVPHRAFRRLAPALYQGRQRLDTCGLWWGEGA